MGFYVIDNVVGAKDTSRAKDFRKRQNSDVDCNRASVQIKRFEMKHSDWCRLNLDLTVNDVPRFKPMLLPTDRGQ